MAMALACLLTACGGRADPDFSAAEPDQPEELIDASRPAPISEMAWRHGEASWSEDGFRDPVIKAKLTDGLPYRIEFYGCSDGRNCTELRFVSIVPAGEVTASEVARWNAARRFGKAALRDNGTVSVEMNVVMTGGTSRANLDSIFGWWHTVMSEFGELPTP